MRVGLISDTHNLVRPEARAFLEGCAIIIHGGDVCEQRVLDEFASIAPTTAVRGNNDKGAWAQSLPISEFVEAQDIFIYVVHDIADMEIDPEAAGVKIVVSGHSHAPSIEEREGVLYVNPGSAGPRRFKLPVSAAELLVNGNQVSARLVDLLAEFGDAS